MNSLNMKPTSVFGLLVLAVTLTAGVHQGPRAITSRERREAQTLTPEQKAEIVDHHNLLRAKEGANNMETMVGQLIYLFHKRTHVC